jgi:hypothetical protein
VTSPDELRERVREELYRTRPLPMTVDSLDEEAAAFYADAVMAAVVTPELERRDAEIGRLNDVRLNSRVQWRADLDEIADALGLEKDLPTARIVHWAKDTAAERDSLRADMGIRHGALNGVLGRSGNPSPSDYYEAIEQVADLVNAARRLARRGSESVPATPGPVRDRPSMVAHPELDFPDCLTEFHRGVVFGWNKAIEEFEDRCRDLDQAAAAPYWDVVRWLEGKVQSYRDQAARVQAPPGLDLPEVEAPLEDLEHLPEAAMDKLVRESLRDSATSEASMEATELAIGAAARISASNETHGPHTGALLEVEEFQGNPSPPAAGEADTTPRVWVEVDLQPCPEGVRLVQDCNGFTWRRLVNDQWITGHQGDSPCGWPYLIKKFGPITELPRVPRIWGKKSKEPADRPPVRDCHGDVWTHVPGTFEWSSPETQNCAWSYMAKKWAPLVEVLPNTEQEAEK